MKVSVLFTIFHKILQNDFFLTMAGRVQSAQWELGSAPGRQSSILGLGEQGGICHQLSLKNLQLWFQNLWTRILYCTASVIGLNMWQISWIPFLKSKKHSYLKLTYLTALKTQLNCFLFLCMLKGSSIFITQGRKIK